MKALIKTVELSKHYKKAIALNDVSITIPEGAIYGLIGNNGAGKTTLMRLLANLQQPTAGLIETDKALQIGALIEYPALYPLMSARGNLMYQLRLNGATCKEAKAAVSHLLELVHLQDTRKRVVHYSLGMKQRLAIALALVGEPDLLILDEPMNGLDPEGIQSMRNLLRRLNEEYGVTILISSHILGELQKVATHYGFLKNGNLIKEIPATAIHTTDLEQFYFQNYLS